ncbi:MAG: TIGR00730 family Rossman fold protein [Alphaproteobacteria bacterium]|nr:TIGR00730 family Rossman fold protein [Alphaproteobacteria bacterium]
MKKLYIFLVSLSSFAVAADRLPVDNIAVFCATSEKIHEDYKMAAKELGALFEPGQTLYFGGAKVGLMGILAEEALTKGAFAEGVAAECLLKYKDAFFDDISLIWHPTLGIRKQYFADKSEALIVLPGGLGTIDEFMDLLAKKQLNENNSHQLYIILVNIRGFWNHLLNHMKHASTEGFIDPKHLNLFKVVNTVQEAPKAIQDSIDASANPLNVFDESHHWWLSQIKD